MKILAIGATGFIGPHVVRRLVGKGHDVALFHRGETDADVPDAATHIYGNRNELPDFTDTFERFAPDVVLDVIPYTEGQARAVVHVFSGIAGRLVVLSSADVYRNYDGFRGAGNHAPDPDPLTEDAALRDKFYPYRGYEALDFEHKDEYDKILVERVVMSAPELPATVLRLPAVYGPGDKQHRFFPYLKRMDDGRPAILLEERQTDWRWTRGYVENVAAAIALAVTDGRAAGQIYNVGEEGTPTEAERLRQFGEAAGWRGEIKALPREELPEHSRTGFDFRYDLATDTGRIREELGYTGPFSHEEALRRTIVWERANPPEMSMEQFDYAAEDAVLSEVKQW